MDFAEALADEHAIDALDFLLTLLDTDPSADVRESIAWGFESAPRFFLAYPPRSLRGTAGAPGSPTLVLRRHQVEPACPRLEGFVSVRQCMCEPGDAPV